jgi:hypothetical protein
VVPLVTGWRALNSVRYVVLSCCIVGTTACESTENPKHPTVGGDAVLESVNNYTSTLDLSVDVLSFDPTLAVTVDWSLVAAGENLQKQPTAPIQLVIIAKEPGTPERAERAIESGRLAKLAPQEYTSAPTTTSALLSDIVKLSDYFDAPETTFILSFAKGNTPGQGIQAVSFVAPVTGSGTTLIQPKPGKEQLTAFTPVFGEPLELPTTNPGTLGWGAVTRDSQGNTLTAGHLRDINRVLLAYFKGKSPTDLETQDTFFALESTATQRYCADLTHAGADPTTAVRLSSLVNSADDTSFNRFAKGGTWLFAAMCDKCNNPAVIVSVLHPVGD